MCRSLKTLHCKSFSLSKWTVNSFKGLSRGKTQHAVMYRLTPHCRDVESLRETPAATVTQVKSDSDLDNMGAVGKVKSGQTLDMFCRESQ